MAPSRAMDRPAAGNVRFQNHGAVPIRGGMAGIGRRSTKVAVGDPPVFRGQLIDDDTIEILEYEAPAIVDEDVAADLAEFTSAVEQAIDVANDES